jgi:hypothetical protein
MTKKRRYKLFCPIIGLFLSACIIKGAVGMEDLTLDKLKRDFFAEVQAKEDTLILTFRSIGQKFTITVDDELPRASQYDEKLDVHIGQNVRITSRNMTLVIGPLPQGFERYGFHITEQIDMRIKDKGILKSEAFVLLLSAPGIDSDGFLKPEEILFIEPDLEQLRQAVE